MSRRIVISVSVSDFADDRDPPTSFVRAFMCESRPLDARDEYDQMQAAQRLADAMVYEMFRRMIAGEPCVPPQVGNAVAVASANAVEAMREREAVFAAMLPPWLRMRAADLKGKTLYHPEHTLEGWAQRVESGEMVQIGSTTTFTDADGSTQSQRVIDWIDNQIATVEAQKSESKGS